MKDIEQLIVNDSYTLKDTLHRLDETSQGVLLLVDATGRLRRTVTDGDIRRLILRGAALEDKLAVLPSTPPKVLKQDSNSMQALSMMNKIVIDHIPVVDDDGRPLSLYLRRELDSQILLSTPHLSEYEKEFVEEAFRTNWIAPLGPNVDAFESELAALVGVGHAAAVSSGTAAIHLALLLLGVGRDDTVFCSSLTFVASANPILYVGAKPVFIDSEPGTWNMSPQALARALKDAAQAGKLPKAVIVVNLYGQSADMDPLMALCDQYGVPMVEDAAESLGATYKGKASGAFGKLGIYSFNGNKIITTSGGGMLVSNDKALIDKARMLSTQARDAAPYYLHSEVGYNYRMSNVLAGIGRGQLKVLGERVAARQEVFKRYQDQLADLGVLNWMPEPAFGRSTHWLTACTIDSSKTDMTPTAFIASLAQEKIEARHLWKPMHQQPLFAGCAYYPHEPDASLSDRLFADGVCLPSGSNMSAEQQDRIIDVIRSLFSKSSGRKVFKIDLNSADHGCDSELGGARESKHPWEYVQISAPTSVGLSGCFSRKTKMARRLSNEKQI